MAEGHGEEQLKGRLNPNAAENRRVEVIVTGKPKATEKADEQAKEMDSEAIRF